MGSSENPQLIRPVFYGCALAAVISLLLSCESWREGKHDRLFERIPSGRTHIRFTNTLTESDSFNYFIFSYIYMGGGVSAGDFNKDGLTDVYLTGNMTSNRLYLNRGDFEFEDVTDVSGTGGDDRWMLGSTICDINDDGRADIYVSVSGLLTTEKNLLYVNRGLNSDGIPVFSEEAGKYGIDDGGLSTQSTFFDYDNDGDLDLYVANYPITQFTSPPFFYRQMMRHVRMEDSYHLYRNKGDGTFTNVTEEAGLLSFGLSLSATVSDLNQDGFKDIFVSNDFTSPDYYFFNNGDGTFTDRTGEVTPQTSFYGMGADIADYNNDGLPDVMQIDMAPEDNRRAKENMSSMLVAVFREMIRERLHYQYKYSTLNLNRGVLKNGLPYFTNAAWIAGVTSTDWSWAALFADFDLDGWKDLYITNGSRRDINNIDYFNRMKGSGYFDKGLDRSEFLEQIRNMPSRPLTNYLFRNNRDLSFSRMNKEWGMTEKSFSNGVAYADLDNDGDLDLVVNNIDQEALIYRNRAFELDMGNYLKVGFEGNDGNKMGIGAVVRIWYQGDFQMGELTLSRGYESSVEPVLYFGLAGHEMIDSLLVIWPEGKEQLIRDVGANQKIILKYPDAGPTGPETGPPVKIFSETAIGEPDGFLHRENDFDDLSKQVLLPHSMSRLGPEIATGDVNSDGLQDFFIGNASGSSACLFIQDETGNFTIREGPWEADKAAEDAGSILFDADSDGDSDLYVVSGGYEFPEDSRRYMDRLYVNDGQGNFSGTENSIPDMRSSGSCVASLDFDRDGDQDLLVGGRQVPGRDPFPASSHLLENRSGKGRIMFVDVTKDVAPSLLESGMVTSVFCADMDGDSMTDFMLAGEWMPVCFFRNQGGRFTKLELEGTTGWWSSLKGADFDGDGDFDLVAGNLGLNARYKASEGKTFDVYAADFDEDGKSDIVLSYYQGKKQYPVRGRDDFISQNPGIGIEFPTYEAFGKATVEDIYTGKALKRSLHLMAETFASCYFENKGNGEFRMHDFPGEAQLAPVNGMIIGDFNNDGKLDVLTAGNMLNMEIVTPRLDAGIGVLLAGRGNGEFDAVPARVSGFFAPNDVKSLAMINHTGNLKKLILVGNNDGKLQVFGTR